MQLSQALLDAMSAADAANEAFERTAKQARNLAKQHKKLKGNLQQLIADDPELQQAYRDA